MLTAPPPPPHPFSLKQNKASPSYLKEGFSLLCELGHFLQLIKYVERCRTVGVLSRNPCEFFFFFTEKQSHIRSEYGKK